MGAAAATEVPQVKKTHIATVVATPLSTMVDLPHAILTKTITRHKLLDEMVQYTYSKNPLEKQELIV